MTNVPKIVPKHLIITLFVVGLLSSVAFRAIIILPRYDPALVRPVWYCGVIGYIIFFTYRYIITQRRKRTIEQSGILTKLETGEALNPDDRAATLYLLNSIRKSPEDWNYLAIGALSVVAVILDWVL
jgi:hypothetical protein